MPIPQRNASTWSTRISAPRSPTPIAGWVEAVEAGFHNQLSYSPYHNIKAGKAYPAILATTADTDNRVVPGHTFKYIAAVQFATPGHKPHLVRIETRAGHGGGKPMDKVIEELADMWAFAARWTGLAVKQADA